MNLTKRQEKQLNKVFGDPKKLRKWLDEVFMDMQLEVKKESEELLVYYINVYSITVAYTAHYVLGLGKKRLPEFMQRIWNNFDCFKSEHLSLDDCINELKEFEIEFESIVKDPIIRNAIMNNKGRDYNNEN